MNSDSQSDAKIIQSKFCISKYGLAKCKSENKHYSSLFNDSIDQGIIHGNSTAKEYETTYTLFIIYILIIVVTKRT